jgi:hypothetical protein
VVCSEKLTAWTEFCSVTGDFDATGFVVLQPLKKTSSKQNRKEVFFIY